MRDAQPNIREGLATPPPQFNVGHLSNESAIEQLAAYYLRYGTPCGVRPLFDMTNILIALVSALRVFQPLRKARVGFLVSTY